MAGGLAQPQGSSQAWPSMGFQAENALNTGWVLDQQVGSTGGLVTNASPTSSGFTFQSTGDATAFYTLGRVLKIVHGGGTSYCTVQQSTYNGTLTNVVVTNFFAGVTPLSTASITSVAAAAVVAGTTSGAVGGSYAVALNVAPTTGIVGNFITVGVSSSGGSPSIGTAGVDTNINLTILPKGSGGLAVGATPATVGIIALPNGQFIYGRNAANSANLVVAGVNSANEVSLGGAGGNLVVGSTYAALSSPTAQSGFFRLPYSTGATIMQRNAGNTADEQIWPHAYATTAISADIALSTGAAGAYTDGPSLSLGPGTWYLTGTVTIVVAGVNQAATAKLWDGTTLLASAEEFGTVSNPFTISLSGVASSSSVWKISVATVNGSTVNFMKASAPDNGTPAKASTLSAMKIQ